MISQREVDPAELEREEDCDEEPAIRMNMLITIVEEADCCKDYVGTTTGIVVKKNCYEFNAAKTTTSGYSMVEDDAKVKQGLLKKPSWCARVCHRQRGHGQHVREGHWSGV